MASRTLMTKARFFDRWKAFRGEPQQVDGVGQFYDDLLDGIPPADLLIEEADWARRFSTKPQPAAGWEEPALALIRRWEGLHLEAYLCPTKVWTIGWGTTQIGGRPVRPGDRIDRARADQLLLDSARGFHAGLLRLIPGFAAWAPNEAAALVSWAYNVGLGAVASSTLRQRISNGEARALVVRQELPRWNKGEKGETLEGLVNRRSSEVALFTGQPAKNTLPAAPAAPAGLPRLIPKSPFSQLVTPNISYGELTLNQEARRFANQEQCDIATELCRFVQRGMAELRASAVIVTSCHRPPAINQQVGGASNSEHLFRPGEGAIDAYLRGVSVWAFQTWCDKNWPYSIGYGANRGFVHIGIRAGRPRVRWDY